MKNVKPIIIQHPSTPDSVKRPHLPAEDALQEALPLLIEVLLECGFDCESEEFQRDFRIVVELLRAILYGQLGLSHELHKGLGENNPLPDDF